MKAFLKIELKLRPGEWKGVNNDPRPSSMQFLPFLLRKLSSDLPRWFIIPRWQLNAVYLMFMLNRKVKAVSLNGDASLERIRKVFQAGLKIGNVVNCFQRDALYIWKRKFITSKVGCLRNVAPVIVWLEISQKLLISKYIQHIPINVYWF